MAISKIFGSSLLVTPYINSNSNNKQLWALDGDRQPLTLIGSLWGIQLN